MNIRQEETDQHGKFFMEADGRAVALMIYRVQQSLLIIDHTEVDEELQGRNIGQHLVTAAAAYARSHHYKVKPLCSFARSVFEKMPELNDVLE